MVGCHGHYILLNEEMFEDEDETTTMMMIQQEEQIERVRETERERIIMDFFFSSSLTVTVLHFIYEYAMIDNSQR